jgi:hypothetical protein
MTQVLTDAVQAVPTIAAVATTVEDDVSAHKSALQTAADATATAVTSAAPLINALPPEDQTKANSVLAAIEAAFKAFEALF